MRPPETLPPNSLRNLVKTFTRSAAAAVVLGVLASSPTVASAQAVMTFTPAACETGLNAFRVDDPYIEAGFQTASPLLGSRCADSEHFAGYAMYIGGSEDGALLTKVGGGTFTLNSIDFAQLFANSLGGTFTLTGSVFGGGTVTQTFDLDASIGTPTFATFLFDPSFTDLTSVSFEPFSGVGYQFDNITLDAESETPEPASLVLLGSGFAAMIVARRRKRV